MNRGPCVKTAAFVLYTFDSTIIPWDSNQWDEGFKGRYCPGCLAEMMQNRPTLCHVVRVLNYAAGFTCDMRHVAEHTFIWERRVMPNQYVIGCTCNPEWSSGRKYSETIALQTWAHHVVKGS